MSVLKSLYAIHKYPNFEIMYTAGWEASVEQAGFKRQCTVHRAHAHRKFT